jgi:hypothetical protein
MFEQNIIGGAMASTCSSCGTEIESADAYFSDAGDMQCKSCFVDADTEQLLARGEDEGNYYAEAEEGTSGWVPFGIGVAMIVGAGVWFGLGWVAGRIYFYPVALGVMGLGSLFKGLLTITTRDS